MEISRKLVINWKIRNKIVMDTDYICYIVFITTERDRKLLSFGNLNGRNLNFY